MKNDWEKSPNDRKEEAFYASDQTKARAKPPAGWDLYKIIERTCVS